MNATRVFTKPNMPESRAVPPEARSAGREGLGNPGRVLYVYDRVSTKNAMQQRMRKTPLPNRGADLSSIYKKQAHIHYNADQYLRNYYNTDKRSGNRPVHMGVVEDASIHMPPPRPKNTVPNTGSTKEFEETRYFSSAASQQRNTHIKHASRRGQASGTVRNGRETFGTMQDDEQTRMFSTPKENPGSGGAAVKKRRKILLEGLINLFETIEERWQRDVDIAKKQALLHKKLQEHKRGLMLALVILLIFSVCCTAIYELLFVVRTVEVSGTSVYSSSEVISASGLSDEVNLYDFRAKEITDRITFYCPYIRTAELSRQLPTTVSLVVEDDEVQYCANIFGEIVALSPGLRVLGTLTPEEAANYILLRLPGITEAVAGRTVIFADQRNERYIRQVLEEVTISRLNGRISYMDLRDEHDLYLYCDGMYELQLGNSADLKMKLRMADTAIADAMFPQNTPARVDLSVVSEASVRADLRLDLNVAP